MPAAPVEPTSRLRVVMGEEELLRARAVSAVRSPSSRGTRTPRSTSSRLPDCRSASSPTSWRRRCSAVTGRGSSPVSPGGRGRPDRLTDRLREKSRPGSDAGRRPLRRQTERGAGRGVHGRRCRVGRVPEAHLGRRPRRLRAQRGPLGSGDGSPPTPSRRWSMPNIGADLRQLSSAAGQLRLRLRRHHRRRRGRPLPPGGRPRSPASPSPNGCCSATGGAPSRCSAGRSTAGCRTC